MKPLHRYGPPLVALFLVVPSNLRASLVVQPDDWQAAREGIPVFVDQRIAWQKANIRSLESWSVLGPLSPEEQVSFANAGANIDRLQQALVDLHEERLVYWQGVLKAAVQRRRKSGAQSISPEERQAQASVDRFSAAQSKIREWRPFTFRSYLDGEIGGRESVHAAATTAQPSTHAVVDPLKAHVSIEAGEIRPFSNHPSLLPEVPASAMNSQGPRTAAMQQGSGTHSGPVHAEVWEALANWASAIEANDPAREADCYGEHLNRYFLRHDVSQAYVRDYLKAWLHEPYHHVAKFVPMGVSFEDETSGKARVRLTKQVVMTEGAAERERLVSSKLEMSKVNGRWKITSEQDLK